MKYFIQLFCFLAVTMTASAQPDTLWTRTIGGEGYQNATGLDVALDGGYILSAYNSAVNASMLYKLDASGQIQWERTYGSSLASVRRMDNGGFILHTWDYLLLVSEFGDSIGIISPPVHDTSTVEFTHLERTASGFVASYYYELWGIRNEELYSVDHTGLLLLDESGQLVDDVCHRFEESCMSSVTRPSSVIQIGDQDFVSVGNPSCDLHAFEITGCPHVGWGWSVNVIPDSVFIDAGVGPPALSPSPSGGFLCAVSVSGGSISPSVWLYQFTDSGSLLWTQINDTPDYDRPRRLQIIDNGYLLAGQRGWGSAQDLLLSFVTSEALPIWSVIFGGDESESFADMIMDSAGHCVIVGKTESFVEGESDIYIVKTTSVLNTVDDFIPHPSSFILSSYPNPFNPSTTLSFSLPRAGSVSIGVFDITGRKVETLAEGRYDAGEHRVTFDGTKLPSGIYFARMQAGDQQRTQKMVLLK